MRISAAAALAAMLICSCGPKPLELPADAVDRAATCGVVTAAEARTATDIQQELPFEAQGRILHHALLASSTGDSFEPAVANRVSRRMSELQEQITKGKWQDLKPACTAAFPELDKKDVALPDARFEAQLGCDSLADFLLTALEPQESDYANELAPYRELRSKLNTALGPGMQSRAGSNLEAQKRERERALATFAKLGTPTAVMRECIARYG